MEAAALYSTLQHSTALYSTLQHSTDSAVNSDTLMISPWGLNAWVELEALDRFLDLQNTNKNAAYMGLL